MKWKLLILFIALSIVLTACSLSEAQVDELFSVVDEFISDASEAAQVEECENEIFSRFYNSDDEQSNSVFESIIETLENKDHAALSGLFSAYAVESCEDMDEDISLLFDFFDGKMVEYKRLATGSSASKDNGAYTKKIFSTYDVTTTTGIYRIAIEFNTIHSLEPDKIGLTSLYIIKGENSNMDAAYWGNEAWGAGIVIDNGEETDAFTS